MSNRSKEILFWSACHLVILGVGATVTLMTIDVVTNITLSAFLLFAISVTLALTALVLGSITFGVARLWQRLKAESQIGEDAKFKAHQ